MKPKKQYHSARERERERERGREREERDKERESMWRREILSFE